MNNHRLIDKVITEQSEIEREPHASLEKSIKTSANRLFQRSRKYECSVCSKMKVGCPCHVNQQRPFISYTFNKNVGHHQRKSIIVNEARERNSKTVPKITFSYAQLEHNHRRNYSYSVPKQAPTHNQPILKEVRTFAVVPPPLQEIIFYPVVHNRVVLADPQGEKLIDSFRGQGGSSNKKAKRSYFNNSIINSSIRRMKEISTNESKQPMTPEQFKKLSEWWLQK